MQLKDFEEIREEYKELVKKHSKEFAFYKEELKELQRIFKGINIRRAKQFSNTNKRLEGADAVGLLLQVGIIPGFPAHINDLENGIVIGSYTHLRAIYESILKSYDMLCDENAAKNHAQQQMGLEADWILAKHEKTLARLYSPEIAKSYQDFYKNISELSHPFIIGRTAIYEKKESYFLESLKTGLGFAHANFVLLTELAPDLLDEETKDNLRKIFVKDGNMPLDGQLVTFLPARKSAIEKLKVKTCADYFEIIDLTGFSAETSAQ